MTERNMCVYCGRWYDLVTMIPLYEEGKVHVNWYCKSCQPAVKRNLVKLPYHSLFRWGEKGGKSV